MVRARPLSVLAIAVLVLSFAPAAAPAPLPAPPVERFAGAGDARGSFAICATRLVATLEGTLEAEEWSVALRVLGARHDLACMPALVNGLRTFRGPLALREGGCLPASDGGGGSLCLDPVLLRVDLGVHWDLCDAVDPCQVHLHGDAHVVAA